MIDKKTFKKAFAAPMQKAKSVKKGQSWYFDGKDAVVVINLQKSNWSELYYINLGIWLKAFGEATFPGFNHCHLYYRVEHFFPEQRDLILTGSDLERSDLEILDNLSKFIGSQLIPFVQECTDEKKLRELMSQGVLRGGFIRQEAKMYLSDK
jgi:hypothetical protein